MFFPHEALSVSREGGWAIGYGSDLSTDSNLHCSGTGDMSSLVECLADNMITPNDVILCIHILTRF